jgi:hypothetical protein
MVHDVALALVSPSGWERARMSPPSDETLVQMVHDAWRRADDAERGHKRLRETLTGLGERIQEYEAYLATVRGDVAGLKERRTDLSQSVLPAKFWLATIALAAAVIGSAYSVKSDMHDQATQSAAESRLQDERILTLKATMDDIKKDAAMQRVQTESLTKMVIGLQRR